MSDNQSNTIPSPEELKREHKKQVLILGHNALGMADVIAKSTHPGILVIVGDPKQDIKIAAAIMKVQERHPSIQILNLKDKEELQKLIKTLKESNTVVIKEPFVPPTDFIIEPGPVMELPKVIIDKKHSHYDERQQNKFRSRNFKR